MPFRTAEGRCARVGLVIDAWSPSLYPPTCEGRATAEAAGRRHATCGSSAQHPAHRRFASGIPTCTHGPDADLSEMRWRHRAARNDGRVVPDVVPGLRAAVAARAALAAR